MLQVGSPGRNAPGHASCTISVSRHPAVRDLRRASSPSFEVSHCARGLAVHPQGFPAGLSSARGTRLPPGAKSRARIWTRPRNSCPTSLPVTAVSTWGSPSRPSLPPALQRPPQEAPYFPGEGLLGPMYMTTLNIKFPR